MVSTVLRMIWVEPVLVNLFSFAARSKNWISICTFALLELFNDFSFVHNKRIVGKVKNCFVYATLTYSQNP